MPNLTLSLRNFRSFQETSVTFGRFTVVVGPNAAGKSNLVEAIRFLRDMATLGLGDAISLQGGKDYLRHLGEVEESSVSISVLVRPDESDSVDQATLFPMASSPNLRLLEDQYTATLHFNKKGPRLRSVEETFARRFEVVKPGPKSDSADRIRKLVVTRTDQGPAIDWDDPTGSDRKGDLLPQLVGTLPRSQVPSSLDTSVLNQVLVRQPPFGVYRPFDSIAIYNIDPPWAKRAARVGQLATLSELGENLPVVLQRIFASPEQRRDFITRVAAVLPFVDKMSVRRIEDKSILLTLTDRSLGPQEVPSTFLSDGTIAVTALITAAYFQPQALAVLEEPERSIHPALLSTLVSMLKDPNPGKVLIVTTHSPEIVKHAGLQNLRLISRDSKGVSRITAPADHPRLAAFLKQELGVEQLFVDNMLDA